MGTLAEIEAATDSLSPEEKRELFLFLATRLRTSSDPLPPPRDFTKDQIEGWIADDEREMRRLRESR